MRGSSTSKRGQQQQSKGGSSTSKRKQQHQQTEAAAQVKGSSSRSKGKQQQHSKGGSSTSKRRQQHKQREAAAQLKEGSSTSKGRQQRKQREAAAQAKGGSSIKIKGGSSTARQQLKQREATAQAQQHKQRGAAAQAKGGSSTSKGRQQHKNSRAAVWRFARHRAAHQKIHKHERCSSACRSWVHLQPRGSPFRQLRSSLAVHVPVIIESDESRRQGTGQRSVKKARDRKTVEKEHADKMDQKRKQEHTRGEPDTQAPASCCSELLIRFNMRL